MTSMRLITYSSFFNRSMVDTEVFFFGNPSYIEEPEEEGDEVGLIFNLDVGPRDDSGLYIRNFKYYTKGASLIEKRFENPPLPVMERYQCCTSILSRALEPQFVHPSRQRCFGTLENGGHEKDCVYPMQQLTITLEGIYNKFVLTNDAQ